MGLASHKGIPIRTGSNTLAAEAYASNKLLYRVKGNDLQGDQRITSLGCSGRDHSSQEEFVSQIFLVAKKEGGQRLVINLKTLNMFVKHKHFKMEGLHILPNLIQPEDWMIKLDLNDAYFQIPIHIEHHHLLQFQWELKTYQFPIQIDISPTAFLQNNETSGGSCSSTTVLGSCSSTTVLCQALQRDYNSDECHSSDIYQQTTGNALPDTVPAWSEDMGVVHSEGCLSGGRTPRIV